MSTQLVEPKTAGSPPGGDMLRQRLVAGLPVEERRLRLAGIATAVLEGGDGPPVVLLHGPGEFAATWMRVIPDLVSGHTVVAPDLPGHGASDLGDGRLEAETILRWLGELVELTCAHPPVLVGHLLGGSVAARYAVDRPDALAGLVLVDSFGLARLRPAPSFALSLVAFLARPSERTQRSLMARCMADLDALRDDMGADLEALEAYALDRVRNGATSAALRRLMPKFGAPAIPPEDLARIAVPTTLIWGRDDLQVRLRTAQAASERHDWPLHVIEGAADDPAVEQPAAFMRALRAALTTTQEAGR
jgi:pimeloyl-ACP methyl ester carboxylesterase